MTAGLSLMKGELTPLAKSVLLQFRLSAATSALSGSLSESGLLVKGISETIKNETKEQKGGFLPMLLGSLAVSLLGSTLTGKGVVRAGEGTIRASENS